MAMQHRADTAANWTSTNPYLALGEIGFETDTGKLKIGNGKDRWSVRPYHNPRSGVELLDHTTLAVDTTTTTITIPDRDDIVKLEIWIRARGAQALVHTELVLRINGITSGIYDYQHLTGTGATATAYVARAGSGVFSLRIPANSAEANQWSSQIIEISFPRKVGPWRTVTTRNGYAYGTASGNVFVNATNGWLRKGMKVDSISFLAGTGNLMAGTQIATFAWVDK